jgi:hypothetical protein
LTRTRPDRIGKKGVQAFLTVERWRMLRHLVTDTERNASDLLDEAIKLIDEKYRKRPEPTPKGKKKMRRAPH